MSERHVRQAFDIALATVEALALAIDAKDRSAHSHIRRQESWRKVWRAIGASACLRADQGVKTGCLAPRHQQARRSRAHSVETRTADAGGFQKIRIHPQVGAEIVAAVPFLIPWRP